MWISTVWFIWHKRCHCELTQTICGSSLLAAKKRSWAGSKLERIGGLASRCSRQSDALALFRIKWSLLLRGNCCAAPVLPEWWVGSEIRHDSHKQTINQHRTDIGPQALCQECWRVQFPSWFILIRSMKNNQSSRKHTQRQELGLKFEMKCDYREQRLTFVLNRAEDTKCVLHPNLWSDKFNKKASSAVTGDGLSHENMRLKSNNNFPLKQLCSYIFALSDSNCSGWREFIW